MAVSDFSSAYFRLFGPYFKPRAIFPIFHLERNWPVGPGWVLWDQTGRRGNSCRLTNPARPELGSPNLLGLVCGTGRDRNRFWMIFFFFWLIFRIQSFFLWSNFFGGGIFLEVFAVHFCLCICHLGCNHCPERPQMAGRLCQRTWRGVFRFLVAWREAVRWRGAKGLILIWAQEMWVIVFLNMG